jgi:hypothetical protein
MLQKNLTSGLQEGGSTQSCPTFVLLRSRPFLISHG